MKRERIGLKIARVLYVLLFVFAAGLLCYQGFISKDLTSGNLVKGIFVGIAAIFGFLRTLHKPVRNKKSVYVSAYGKIIGNSFEDDPKLEKEFYKAIDDFHKSAYAAGIRKLEKLDEKCSHSAQRFAVQFFIAKCHENMNNNPAAMEAYHKALTLRQHSSAASNLGMCYMKAGNFDRSLEFYQLASRLDSKNPFPLNNIAQLYIRQGEYESAIPYALRALELEQNFQQALNALTICYAMLDDQQQYEQYYRRSVSCGSDGSKLKAFIRSLQDSN